MNTVTNIRTCQYRLMQRLSIVQCDVCLKYSILENSFDLETIHDGVYYLNFRSN